MTHLNHDMRSLNMSYTLTAADMFAHGKRTDQIARKMKVPEAAIANSLARLREFQREQRGAA